MSALYFPYFRGKQYELLTIREKADLMAERAFVPIVEPVKDSLAGVERALAAVENAEGQCILVVNPYHGDHAHDSSDLESFVAGLGDSPHLSLGVALTGDVSVSEASRLLSTFDARVTTLIHAGFRDARGLADRHGDRLDEFTHVFVEDRCTKLYRRRFSSGTRVLVRDGFRRQRNRDYADVEAFSDLHVTFVDEGAQAFGDFLIVGDDYIESGGPAYAVAIHLTYIDPDHDHEMWIHHFKSDRTNTPKDPAGKFAEALEKLVAEVEREGSKILRSRAVEEFCELRNRGHFPGLGTVKKLSMNHHIETLADYFGAEV